MLKIYLSLESIAREFKEVVVGTRLFRLPSGEPAKLRIELVDGVLQMFGFLFPGDIHTTGTDSK